MKHAKRKQLSLHPPAWGKFFSILLFILLLILPSSSSFFNDTERSVGNVLAAGTLDFSLSSPTENFITDPESLRPDSVITRQVTVANTGTLPITYQGMYQYLSGDTSLCQTLTLAIQRGTETIFDGHVSDFTGFDSDQLLIPSASDSLTFTVTLPVGTPLSMSGKTCSFNVIFDGWVSGKTKSTSGFTDSEILTGNNVGTADFEPPPAPQIFQHKNDVAVNSSALTECFEIVSDPQDLHNPVTYEYESYSDPGMTALISKTSYTESGNKEACGSFGEAIVRHDEGAGEGHVYHRIRAVDTAGNASAWTTAHFVIDNTAPSTAISVSHSPARTISETVVNPGFEIVDGSGNPAAWDTEGDVSIVTDEFGVAPWDGSRMAKIGRDTDPGQDYSLNSISQPIPNSAKNISFWYNFHTYDGFGYDEPGFAVFLNDTMVYHIWASDIASGGNPDTTGWKQFLYDLSSIDQVSQPILTIVFHAGNSVDPDKQSWVYVDSVSTADVVVNSSATFTLSASDNLTAPASWYQIGSDGTPTRGSSFQLSAQPTDGTISYWSTDEAGNEEDHKTLRVVYDNDRPDPIDDLEVADWENGEFTLSFRAVDPNDTVTGNTTASSYDVRYSTSPITDDPSFDSAAATASASPRPAGEQESLWVKGLIPGIQYWFAVKAKDASPNTSILSTGSVATSGPTVVLNEFMPDPTGNDDGPMPGGEGVELYNNAGYDINVADWKLYDALFHELSITPANTNTGNTIVPSHGFLVVYKNNDADFSLNNDGDSVYLYHKARSSGGMLIDSYSYTTVTTNKTYARVPDGSGPWIDPMGTPGGKNTNEQGSYTIGEHEPDDINQTSDVRYQISDGSTESADLSPTPTPEPTPEPTPDPTPTPNSEPTVKDVSEPEKAL